MARQSLQTLTNALTRGALDRRLKQWREEGASYMEITRRMRDEFEIEVSDETARLWCREIETV